MSTTQRDNLQQHARAALAAGHPTAPRKVTRLSIWASENHILRVVAEILQLIRISRTLGAAIDEFATVEE
jgi:hypothetical protein